MILRLLISFFIIFLNISCVFAEENFSYYLKDLRQTIDNIWNPPVYYQRYTADISFKVYKDGTIKDIKIANSSRIKQLDNKAIETISKLKKVSVLPSSYSEEYIYVTVSLTNYIKNDLKNIYVYKKKNNQLYMDSLPIATKLVKIKRVVYNSTFKSASNYKENMKKLELNLDIAKAKGAK